MVETLTQELKIIVFQLKEKEYAIPVEQVRSIEKEQHITRVPGVATYINGVINLRGVVTPIVDLGKRLDLGEAEKTENTRIIIAVFNEIEVGFIVDAANDVLDIPRDSIEPPPEIVGGTEEEYINGVVKIGKRLLILLDLEMVMNGVAQVNRIEGN
ncbi:chemotaxis protein CheW [Neobacillus sp. PS3-40]|uniref:chemotaxis protein CheW n=1 Tax=Neobacillus sp. PS3-40 TaxID=3070679 RepID=UPI0027E18DB5|nr:chemotaxis protein CheW [Neobacillus sp. PS3-40]WML43723.1 chemotaxis protein CheW [Neobacillus sp. PS3-40]